jgi:hypothetical protein
VASYFIDTTLAPSDAGLAEFTMPTVRQRP